VPRYSYLEIITVFSQGAPFSLSPVERSEVIYTIIRSISFKSNETLLKHSTINK